MSLVATVFNSLSSSILSNGIPQGLFGVNAILD